MKTKLIVANKVSKRVFEIKLFELDLADMATLIDWNNPDTSKVLTSIQNISTEIEVYGNLDTLPELDKITKEAISNLIEEKAYRDVISKGIREAYFVDLYDWKERPPKKLKKPQGERVFFIQTSIGIMNEFVIRISKFPYFYQKESDKSEENVKKSNGILEIEWNKNPDMTYSQSSIKELKDLVEREEQIPVVCIYRKKDEDVLRKVLTPNIAKLFF